MVETQERNAPDRLGQASMALAALGALDSIYLIYIKISHAQAAFCAPGGGCDIVNGSPFSEIGGVPIAVLGLGAYLLMIALLWLQPRSPFLAENGPLILFGLSLTGVLYSAYLTYLELFVINAICPYCVVSAVLLVGLLVLSILRLRQQNLTD